MATCITYWAIAAFCVVAAVQANIVPSASKKNADADPYKCGNLRKGCVAFPPNCTVGKTCTQFVVWTVSPDDKRNVRFDMVTNLTIDIKGNKSVIDYVAFGLAVDGKSFMGNNSVLVCALNHTSGHVTAYLSHNANGTSTHLPLNEMRAGIKTISTQKDGNKLWCIVDRAIEPTPGQVGLSFPLNMPWIPAFAIGPTDPKTGFIQHHYLANPYMDPVTLTNY